MHLISSYLEVFLCFGIVYIFVCVCVCVCMFVSNICAYNIYMHIVVNCLVAKLCPTLRPYGL